MRCFIFGSYQKEELNNFRKRERKAYCIFKAKYWKGIKYSIKKYDTAERSMQIDYLTDLKVKRKYRPDSRSVDWH